MRPDSFQLFSSSMQKIEKEKKNKIFDFFYVTEFSMKSSLCLSWWNKLEGNPSLASSGYLSVYKKLLLLEPNTRKP